MKKFLIIFVITAAVSTEFLSIDQLKDIVPLVTGGSPAAQGQFPHQVAVVTVSDTNMQFCGGTLIKHKWVLTVNFKLKF